MKQKRLAALALALAMCLSVLPAGAFAAEESRDTNFFTQREHTDLKYEDLEYVRPDGEAILAKMEEIRSLLNDKANMEKVSTLFDAIGEDFIMVQTMYSLCNIQAYQDVTSEAWDEMEVLGEMASNLSDQLSILMKDILNSDCAAFLAEQLDEESIEYYKNYTPMTEEQLAFAAKEAALESEYQTAAANLPTVEIDGVAYDYDSLYAAAVNGEISVEVYNTYGTELAKAKNEVLGEIYLRMVKLRQDEARSYGYDNYAEYAYAEIYTRDYTPEEIRAFHAAVKEYIVPLYDAVYDRYVEYAYAGAYDGVDALDYSGDISLDLVEPYLSRMSDELVEAFTFMREGGYYDNAISETKAPAGFTTELAAYGAPFFFLAGSGWVGDFTTTVHEFGHYNEGYWASNEFIDYTKNIDIAEVHSQGMELMFSQWYPEIFGEVSGEAMEVYLIYNLLGSIVDGCLHDELQQYVYYTPDVTLKQINQKYRALMTEYGQVDAADPRDEMYSWVDISHTFMQPCYYISYAVSAAGAFAFWLDAQETDYYEALDNYLAFVALPGSYTFTESFEQVDLESPLDPAYIRALAGDLCWAVTGEPLPGTYDVAVNVNGTYLQFPDAQPAVVNDRTMLPVRALVESMGADVKWDEATSQVTITLNDVVVTLTIGSKEITVKKGGETTTASMDVAPFIDAVYERTYVPLRFVSEAFGLRVGWDDPYRTAIILDAENVAAAMLEGKSFTCLAQLLQFVARGQEGKDQGIWNTAAEAEGTLTIGGALEVPMTGTLNAVTADGTKLEMGMNMTADLTSLLAMMTMAGSAPDAETQALIKTLAQDGLGLQFRGDLESGKVYFTAADALLEQSGFAAGTWFLADKETLSAVTGEEIADLPAAGTPGDLAAQLSTMELNSVDEVVNAILTADKMITFLSDESFVADTTSLFWQESEGESYLSTMLELAEMTVALEFTVVDDTIADVTVYADNTTGTGSVLVFMDSTGAVTGQASLEVPDTLTLELSFSAQTVKGDTAPAVEPPAGATVLDLSDPEVANKLMGVMPLPEEDAA
ncbi:MAG: hypothetical protein J6C43_02080 [Oscillospiraceae bacterium]|nr:hypothetical protein [Oscillospiraceae bacterium]